MIIEDKQQVAEQFKNNYDVEIEHKTAYENAVKIDLVIKSKDEDKKVYVVFKNRKTRPIMLADVVQLDYVRLKDIESGKNNYQYMVFCEKKRNVLAESAASDVSIPYYKNFHNLVDGIQSYFSK